MPGTAPQPLTPAWFDLYANLQTTMVRAGAGAGKTTELVQRVLAVAKKFHRQQGHFPKLVVTTFTRKATQELRERLMLAALDMKDEALIDFVQRRSQLHISTIHGVLNLFLARYGSKMGLNPKFSFIEARQEQRMLKKVLRDLLNDPASAEPLEELLQQVNLKKLLEAFKSYIDFRYEVNEPLRPAQAKDGFEILRRQDAQWVNQAEQLIDWICRNEKPESWANYLQLLKAAKEQMKEQMKDQSPGQNWDPGQRQAILQNFFAQKGRPVLKNADEEIKKLRTDVQDYAKAPLRWIDTPEGWRTHQQLSEKFVGLAELVHAHFLEQKKSAATLTMQDLELFSLKLIHDFPESARMFSQDWNYWLVDEYQDTSPRQVFLLKNLVGESNQFIVGDPQQSIYLFRGARSEVFQNREKEVQNDGGSILQKMENYRSRAELLRFFNHFFSHLVPPPSTSPDFGSVAKVQQFRDMIPARPSEQPETPAAHFIFCEEDAEVPAQETDGSEKKLEIPEQLLSKKEYQAVMQRCLELLKQGVSPEKICVLSRTNRDLEVMAEMAAHLYLPVQVHSSAKFYSRREVKDALALLKFLANPADNLTLLCLLRSPWFQISDTDLVRICRNYSQNFWGLLRRQLPNHESIQKLLQLQQVAVKKGLGQAWFQGLIEGGLMFTANMIEASGRREANLWKLVNQLRLEEKQPGFSYLEFAERAESSAQDLEAGSDGDATPVEEPQRINLMTVHASKGLQFDHVILPAVGKIQMRRRSHFFNFDEDLRRFTLGINDPESGLTEQNLCAIEVGEKIRQRELMEYDRLLYVALTRAKFDVTLIWSKVQEHSWAKRMWRPEQNGWQMQQGFATHLQSPFRSQLTPESLPMTPSRTVPLALSFPALKAASLISVTHLLEKQDPSSSSAAAKTQFRNQPVASTSERVEKALFGVKTHRLLESLKYREDAFLAETSDHRELQFVKDWNQGQLLRWIEQGHVEWGFSVALEDDWIQGQIDLWALEEDGSCVVVDYKTGSSRHAEKAFQQLEIYSWALKKMRRVPATSPTKLVIIYPFENKVLQRTAREVPEVQNDLREKIQGLKRSSLSQ